MKQLFVFLSLCIISSLYAQNSKQNITYGNDWVATDALGRNLPTYEEVGPTKPDKYVGVFYFFWHWNWDVTPIKDVTKILAANPTNTSWISPDLYYWGEPEAGYYCADDPWVIRRHIQLLADAGVDFVFIDYTNDYLSSQFDTTLQNYCRISEELKKQGIDVPKIVFFFHYNPAPKIEDIYDNFYKLGEYSDLWFYWDGKPLILADSGMTFSSSSTAGLKFSSDSSFTGVMVNCPTWNNASALRSLTLKLYNWNKDYETTVSGIPIADTTFNNFNDNAYPWLNFNSQPAGDYYWELSNPNGVVGVWKFNNTKDSVTSYFSGQVDTTGNYISQIRYVSGSSYSLTNSYGTGTTPVQLFPGEPDSSQIRNFFTWREMWDFSGTQNQWWKYTDNYPQTPFYHDGQLEQICVSKAIGAPVWPIGGVDNRGSSFHNGQAPTYDQYYLSKYTPYGLNFQDQWNEALKIDPPIVTVTGWNEWIASAFDANVREPEMLNNWYFMGNVLTTSHPYYFVDEFNMEFNRDIEPMKGGYTDDYYYQLVSNIRKYKGLNPPETATPPMTISMDGNFMGWSTVEPVYRDAAGDVAHRYFRNIDGSDIYENTTGRNDIIESRVTYDSSNVYFYVKTDSSLTPYTDKNWMLLFIDADTNHTTGWEGYDYVINLNVKSDSVTTLATWNGQDSSWVESADLKYRYVGNQMEIRVSRNLINQMGKNITFYFHWADNIQKLNDITEFFINGDSAPDRRFNYFFTSQIETSVKETNGQPSNFSLSQNYPNPFNPTTLIKYSIPKSGIVTLKVYNLLGQEVATLVNQEQNTGNYTVNFDASKLASGVYMYSLQSGDFSLTKKMALLK
ncbi:MAG: T9SS type A sorting domain-containing protein [Ignavibacteriaceae bacterium]